MLENWLYFCLDLWTAIIANTLEIKTNKMTSLDCAKSQILKRLIWKKLFCFRKIRKKVVFTWDHDGYIGSTQFSVNNSRSNSKSSHSYFETIFNGWLCYEGMHNHGSILLTRGAVQFIYSILCDDFVVELEIMLRIIYCWHHPVLISWWPMDSSWI